MNGSPVIRTSHQVSGFSRAMVSFSSDPAQEHAHYFAEIVSRIGYRKDKVDMVRHQDESMKFNFVRSSQRKTFMRENLPLLVKR